MNQNAENTKVPNVVHFKDAYKRIVHELVQARNASGVTQEFISDWLAVDRRKIISFENLKKVNIELLLKYADKFSIDIKLKFEIN